MDILAHTPAECTVYAAGSCLPPPLSHPWMSAGWKGRGTQHRPWGDVGPPSSPSSPGQSPGPGDRNPATACGVSTSVRVSKNTASEDKCPPVRALPLLLSPQAYHFPLNGKGELGARVLWRQLGPGCDATGMQTHSRSLSLLQR